jgi:hypothetical protein
LGENILNAISMIVLATDVMMPITVLSIGWTILRARKMGPSVPAIFAILAAALLAGAAWSWLPQLAALRFLPAPQGQGGAILGLIVALNLLRLVPSVRSMFQSIDIKRLIDLGPWRVIYGCALLVIGLLGGLPPEFFWSAAFGDIVVGLWAIAMMARRPQISTREVIAWNVVGLIDLVHVLVLGAIYLRGFYLMLPDVVPLNLLPLTGVPLLLVMHIQTLLGQFKKANAK